MYPWSNNLPVGVWSGPRFAFPDTGGGGRCGRKHSLVHPSLNCTHWPCDFTSFIWLRDLDLYVKMSSSFYSLCKWAVCLHSKHVFGWTPELPSGPVTLNAFFLQCVAYLCPYKTVNIPGDLFLRRADCFLTIFSKASCLTMGMAQTVSPEILPGSCNRLSTKSENG